MNLILLALVGGYLYSQPQLPASELASKLRVKDEVLLNAVHRGDRRAWEKATTPDFIYIEDGDILERAPFLDGLQDDGFTPLIIRTYKSLDSREIENWVQAAQQRALLRALKNGGPDHYSITSYDFEPLHLA